MLILFIGKYGKKAIATLSKFAGFKPNQMREKEGRISLVLQTRVFRNKE